MRMVKIRDINDEKQCNGIQQFDMLKRKMMTLLSLSQQTLMIFVVTDAFFSHFYYFSIQHRLTNQLNGLVDFLYSFLFSFLYCFILKLLIFNSSMQKGKDHFHNPQFQTQLIQYISFIYKSDVKNMVRYKFQFIFLFQLNLTYNPKSIKIMEIELDDYENGRPIVVKTTNQIATKIKVLKSAKKYQDIFQLTQTMPNTKQKYLMQANALMHLKRWKQLSECCDRGLELDEASDFYNLKGKALGKMEQYHEKIELTKKAIQIEPKVPAYHRNLGAGYYKIKEYDLAIEEHNKAIKFEPKNAINYHNKGAAYFRKKQYEEAKKCFVQAIELDKNQAISYAWLADSEKELGNYEKAKHFYDRAYDLTKNPQYQKQKKAMDEKIKPEKKGFFSKIFG